MLLTKIWETCSTDHQKHETADWRMHVLKKTWPLTVNPLWMKL